MRKQGFTVVNPGGVVACICGVFASVLVTVLLLILCVVGITNDILEVEWAAVGAVMIHLLSSLCGVVLSQKMFKKDKIVAALVVGMYCVLSLFIAIFLFDGVTKSIYLKLSSSAIGGLLGYITSGLRWEPQKRYKKRK